MKRLCLVLAIAAACSKKPEPPAGDADVEAFLADFIAYGDKSVVMLASFDGNCSTIADQMLTLEPLAQKIRTNGLAIEADPARAAKKKQRIGEMKQGVMQHYEELLKPLGKTMDDITKKEAEMKTKCAGDPKWEDAIERTGLMKKKKP
jgi:hypothetical protein